jgi:uncharacterized phage-associated protein
MSRVYSAMTIAKWIINKVHPEPLKLQKLLYLAQGYSYAFYDEPLFNDEIEGWVHGPVVRSVYNKYKDYQYNPIKENYNVSKLDKEAEEVLNYVINNFAQYDSKTLENISHNQEPWINSRKGLDPDERSDKTISKSDIANYFTNEIYQPGEEEWE